MLALSSNPHCSSSAQGYSGSPQKQLNQILLSRQLIFCAFTLTKVVFFSQIQHSVILYEVTGSYFLFYVVCTYIYRHRGIELIKNFVLFMCGHHILCAIFPNNF